LGEKEGETGGDVMGVATNKALVGRYVELYATGEGTLADEIIAADFVDHTHPEAATGPEGVKREVAAFRAAFPDATVAVEQVIGEGDIVAFRFTIQGTQQGRSGPSRRPGSE